MWKPAERIHHDIPLAVWPTAAEAAASLLFAPLPVGAVTLEQRTWVPAMVPWRATEDGFVTPHLLAWYERFARGRPGALVVEATGIRDVPSGPLLRIGHDRFVPGLAELVARVRRASAGHTRLFLQVIDFLTIRRRPEPETFFRRYLRLTDRHRAAFPGRADEEVREQLPVGGVVVLYTDGVIEARREGEFFGLERLDDVLVRKRALPATELAQAVLEECRAFAGGELADDCAVVVIRRTA